MRRRTMPCHFARPAAAAIALGYSALVSSYGLAIADPAARPDAAPTELSGSQGTESAPNSVSLSAEAQALRDVLNFDPVRAMTTMPATPLRAPSHNASAHDLDWNRTDKADGSAAVTVKKPLPNTWDANVDTKVGADFALATMPTTSYQPSTPWLASKDPGWGGDGLRAAWANVTVPGIASIDARLDPGKEQSKLGTTISRSLPIGGMYSVTLQNTYALTETLGSTPTTPAIPSSATPVSPLHVWSTDRLVKFNIHSTGTTLAAGTTSSTVNNVTHNKISAEQKLFGPLNVTTAVTDVGAANISKSITAGFKFKW